MTNWTPQLDESLPTTRLRFGRTDLNGDPPLVRLTRVGGETAVFEAEVEDDSGFSTKSYEGDMYHHPQVAALYGRLDPSARYQVEPVNSRAAVPVAEEVSIDVQRGRADAIESFLKGSRSLVHPSAREIVPPEHTPSGQGGFEFDVYRSTPDAHTVRVTEKTDVKQLDAERVGESPEPRYDDGGGSDPDAGDSAGSRGGSGNGADDEDRPNPSDYIDERTPERGFDQVVGVEGGRRQARKISRILVPEIREALEKKYGEIKTGSALLMYGPPGCGKTLTAEAIAHELKHRCLKCGEHGCDAHRDTIESRLGKVRFLEVECTKISSKYVGQAPDRLDVVFDRAFELADGDGFVVLFFDELDSLITESADAENNSAIEVTNTFLRRAQGSHLNDKDILLVGATNHPYLMDTAALDRFSFEMLVPPPSDTPELAELWRGLVDGQEDADELDFQRLAEASLGFAPRELEHVRRQTVENITGGENFDPDDLPSLRTEDYLDTLEETNPATIDRYLSRLGDNIRDLRGWDELREFYREWTELLHDDGDAAGDEDGSEDVGRGGSAATTDGDGSTSSSPGE